MKQNTSLKILVTGAGGQLGLTLAEKQKSLSGGVWVFKNSSELDIADAAALEKLFDEVRPDICINCAAYTNVEKAEAEPKEAFKVNADAVKHLALICKNYGASLIHISTDYVFDGLKGAPYIPSDTPNPLNVYGRSKLAGEHYVQEILERYYIIRTSWLYSRQFGKNFYRSILQKAKAGEPLKVVNDQVGCPTDTEHLAEYIIYLVQEEEPFGIKHFCDGQAMSWYEFALKIIQEHGLHTSVEAVDSSFYKQTALRPAYSVLVSSAFKRG